MWERLFCTKEPPTQSTGNTATFQATKDEKVSFINDVLKEPKLARLICEYID